jgi:hypothetical protein
MLMLHQCRARAVERPTITTVRRKMLVDQASGTRARMAASVPTVRPLVVQSIEEMLNQMRSKLAVVEATLDNVHSGFGSVR